MVIASAKMCLTDSVMLFFLTAAQLALFSIYQNSKATAAPWLFWIALGGAVLTKGPFPLVVLFATLVALAAFDVGRNFKSLAAWLIFAWRRRRVWHVRFALATIVGNWIFVELMITKLPHYMLPSFSSLAFLCGYLLYWWMEYDRMPRAMRIGSIIWRYAAAALAFLPWLPRGHFPFPIAGAIAFTAVGLGYALVVPILWNLRRVRAAVNLMGFGMMLVIAI